MKPVKKKKPVTVVLDRDSLVVKAKQMLVEGYSRKYISKKLSEISTATDIDEIVAKGFTLLKDDYINDPKEIIIQHVKRYDAMVMKLLKVADYDQSLIGKPIGQGGITLKRWQEARSNKVKACSTAIDSLVQKENLLHLSYESLTTVNINSEVDINVNDSDQSGFDPKRLNLEQQSRMYYLMKKQRQDHDEPKSVMEVVEEEVKVVHDVIAEVFPANVEQIKHVLQPAPIEEKKPGLTIAEIREKLRQAALKRSNLTSEQKLLND